MVSIALGRMVSASLLVAVLLFGTYSLSQPALPVLDDASRQGLDGIMDGGLIALSDGLTHYKWTLPARPAAKAQTVVFVHGSSLPSFVFDANARALADEGYRVLTYDLFGRGFSDRPPMDYDTQVFDRQLSELLAKLEVTDPVHIIGYSMGAVIAANFTGRHRDHVSSVILIAPTGAGPAVNDHTRDLFALAKDKTFGPWAAKFLGPVTLRTLADSQFADALDRSRLREAFESQLKFDGYIDALVSTVKNFPMVAGAAEYYKTLGELSIPVVAIWGEGDNFAPYKNVGTLKALIPNLQIRAHPTADHNIPFAHPQFVNESLKLHLAQLNWSK